jgi:hypothetical protein
VIYFLQTSVIREDRRTAAAAMTCWRDEGGREIGWVVVVVVGVFSDGMKQI